MVWDSDYFKRPRRRYISSRSYSWRAFALCLSNLSTADRINPDPAAASQVEVEGESGLVAEILRRAYASGDGETPEFLHLLIQHRDDCLLDLEEAVGDRLSDELQAQLADIASDLDELGLEPDLCAVARVATGGNELDLRSIAEYLSTKVDAKRYEDARQRDRLLAPFKTSIDTFVEKFDDRPLRGGGMVRSPRSRVRSFLEDYVIANGCLPTGPVRVKSESRSFSLDLGTIEFPDIVSPTSD